MLLQMRAIYYRSSPYLYSSYSLRSYNTRFIRTHSADRATSPLNDNGEPNLPNLKSTFVDIEKSLKSILPSAPVDRSTPVQSSIKLAEDQLPHWTKLHGRHFSYKNVKFQQTAKVSKLAHGLDRVLFNPGVHFLQDPRSKVYNFTPYLRNIVQPDQIDFDTLSGHISASKDENLINLAKTRNKRFVSSTSSMTGVLSQLYHLISAGKPVDTSRLSSAFHQESKVFTRMTRMPASICLKYQDGVYSIDADKSFDRGNTVLSLLGKSMERMLTCSESEFSKHLKSYPNKGLIEALPDAYNFATAEDFLLRAQLDCMDERLPKKTFDLKTRASIAIRLDVRNYLDNLGYLIKYNYGLFESFEREYYDMMRAAFLKYSMQVRIGQMDGIFVAFHNTARIFGFQYVSLDEIDDCIFGNSMTGEQAFGISLKLLNAILNRVTKKYEKKDLRITFDADAKNQHCDIYVEEMDPERSSILPNLKYLDCSSSEFNPPSITYYRMGIKNYVNDQNLGPDAYPHVSTLYDKWNLEYLLTEVDTGSDMTLFDYLKLRSRQKMSENREPGGGLVDKLRREFMNGNKEDKPEKKIVVYKLPAEYVDRPIKPTVGGSSWRKRLGGNNRSAPKKQASTAVQKDNVIDSVKN
ncbi:mitochondrial protein Pet127-domain-containing protein [Paraphysoderma sedebokerense]|nr:mitochondrial protein Pet127-domain-containing protein [Paraphysoderma sedebokerense]